MKIRNLDYTRVSSVRGARADDAEGARGWVLSGWDHNARPKVDPATKDRSEKTCSTEGVSVHVSCI